jgi:hypothetical protein
VQSPFRKNTKKENNVKSHLSGKIVASRIDELETFCVARCINRVKNKCRGEGAPNFSLLAPMLFQNVWLSLFVGLKLVKATVNYVLSGFPALKVAHGKMASTFTCPSMK